MGALDSLFFNMVVIILSICLFEMVEWFRSDRPHALQAVPGRVLLVLTNSLIALFCVTHPIRLVDGTFDLRLIPFLVSFVYGSFFSGFTVSAIILTYQYLFGQSGFLFTLFAFSLLLPVCILLSKRPAWRTGARLTHPLLLTVICLGIIVGLHLTFAAFHPDIIQAPSWLFVLLYNVLHIAAIWLISLLVERMRINMAMHQKLIRSEKVTVLSELAAAVAHEIRNPMTVARGFMQLLSQTEVNEDKKQIYTTMVIEEIDRAEQIITDYLSFAKPQAQQVRPLDLKDAVQQSLQIISPYATARGVELRSALPDSPMPMLAELERLVQCFVNVCKHSIDAMPGGGTLSLRLRERLQGYSLEVRDSGGGMTDEEISRLGTPFYAMNTEGTGLSMMVAYRIVESLRGQIEVRSTPTVGSTFTISFSRPQP